MAKGLILLVAIWFCLLDTCKAQNTEQDLFRLALSQTLKEEYNQALLNFNEIIAINPAYWDAYLYRSLCNLKTKNFKKKLKIAI